MNFVDRYLERSKRLNSVLCVGLDPTPDHVPPGFGVGLMGLEEYLRQVICIAAERVPVIKPQYAYFAAYGLSGIAMIPRVAGYAHSKGLLVILDAKRADIDATMAAYGKEVFDRYGVDACTFVPYLGSTFMHPNPDAKENLIWLPWLAQGRAVVSMIRTSNLEADQLQDLMLASGLRLYEHVAGLVKEWNEDVRRRTNDVGCVGGVVGATWPEQALRCRELAGDDVFFLVPGYGEQGGGAKGAVGGLRNSRGEWMGMVNSSRGITLTSWYDRKAKEPRKGDPLDLVTEAIDAANADLNKARAALN